MKQQYTLTELAQKLDTLEAQKRDFVTDTRKVEFIAGDKADCALALNDETINLNDCLLYTSPSPRDSDSSRMPSSA